MNIPSDTGFLFEYDAYFWNEQFYLPTSYPFPLGYTFKHPEAEALSAEKILYMKEVIGQMERSVSQGDYPQYIDVESFAKWALAQDILGTKDYYGTNIYLMKDGMSVQDKIRMGILWDFDSIMELWNMWAGIHYAGSCFIRQLFINTQCTDFVAAYRKCWNKVVENRVIENLIDSLSMYGSSAAAVSADRSRMLDGERWGKQCESVEEDVSAATVWFTDRYKFLNDTITALYSKYDATLPVLGLEQDKRQSQGCYDLQGRRLLKRPERGIYICGGKKYVVK